MDVEVEAGKIRAELEKFALPTIKLKPKAENAKNRWSSKFGGEPYWPKDMKYPESKSGNKLTLLAQLNINEFPNLPDFPKSGILQFFIEDDDVYGLDFYRPIEEIIKAPSGYRVVYHSIIERDESLLENGLPKAHKESCLPLSREYRLESVLDKEIPSPRDFRYKNYAKEPYKEEGALADYIYDNFTSTGCKIGGYAFFTQEDPRINGEDDNWVLLFQMDSEFLGDDEIMWGDLGVANFFIEKEALKKNDFSRVWYNWDCS